MPANAIKVSHYYLLLLLFSNYFTNPLYRQNTIELAIAAYYCYFSRITNLLCRQTASRLAITACYCCFSRITLLTRYAGKYHHVSYYYLLLLFYLESLTRYVGKHHQG